MKSLTLPAYNARIQLRVELTVTASQHGCTLQHRYKMSSFKSNGASIDLSYPEIAGLVVALIAQGGDPVIDNLLAIIQRDESIKYSPELRKVLLQRLGAAAATYTAQLQTLPAQD